MDQELTDGCVGLCFLGFILSLIGLGIWGFVKLINWVVTLG